MKNLVLKRKDELAKKKKGFTLIELIIVIAIIAILAAMAIPKMGSIRETANKKADLATAKNIATIISTKISQDEKIESAGKVNSNITNDLDGKKTPQVSGKNNFYYEIGSTGDITIKYDDGTIVYPVNK